MQRCESREGANTTKSKLSILENLTARLTYAIRLISELITDDTKIDRKSIRSLVKESDVVEKTCLSAGFIDQCIDKVIWAWKSYNKLHKKWGRKLTAVREKGIPARDDKEKRKGRSHCRCY